MIFYLLNILQIALIQTKYVRIRQNAMLLSNKPENDNTNSFSQYGSLFEAFSQCTLHYSWRNKSNLLLHQRLLLYQIKRKLESTNIHTGYQFSNKRNFTKMLKLNINVQHGNYWNLTEFEDISPVYHKIFSNIRYGNPCRVQLPGIDVFEEENLENYFRFVVSYENLRRIKKPLRLNLPNFVILPLNLKELNKELYTVPISNLMYTPTLILLALKSFGIYLACTRCLNNVDYPTPNWIPLINIQYEIQNFENLNKFKKLIMWKTKSLESQLSKYSSYWNSHEFAYSCPYKINQKITTNPQILATLSVEDCTKFYIGTSINCTSISCRHIIVNDYIFSVPLFYESAGSWQHFSPYAIQMFGFRFAVFINKRVQKAESLNANMLAFLAPVDFTGWMILLITITILCVQLKLNMLEDNPLYWIFAVILEQEDDCRKSLNSKNWHIILLWIFTSILLRNVYTSSMYTYLTMEPDPKDIPENFDELIYLYNGSMKLLGHYLVSTELNSLCLRFSGKVDGKAYPKLEKMCVDYGRTLWWYDSTWESLIRLSKGKPQKNNTLLCNDFKKTVSKSELDKFDFQECLKWSKFGLLYKTFADRYDFQYSSTISLYSKILLAIQGKYKIFENNDPPKFTEMNLWLSDERNYLADLFSEKLAMIVESGIYRYQNYQFELQALIVQIATFLKYSGINTTLNLYSLASHLQTYPKSLMWYNEVSSMINGEDYVESAKNEEFKVIWVMFLGLCFVLLIIFACELFAGSINSFNLMSFKIY